MPRPKSLSWTDAARTTLREAYASGGMAAARQVLSDRSWAELEREVSHLRLPAPRCGEAQAPRLEGALLEEAVALHEAGWGFGKIGSRLGYADTTVSNLVLISMCARRGFVPAPRDERGWLTSEGRRMLCDLIDQGLQTGEIQVRLGVNASMVAYCRRHRAEIASGLSFTKVKLPGRAGASKRARRLPSAERKAIAAMLRDGWADRHVSLSLSVPLRAVQVIRRLLDDAGELPPLCPCGKSRGHNGPHADQALRDMPRQIREIIEAGLRAGKANNTISKETGVVRKQVGRIAIELAIAGDLPDVCPCGGPRGHGGVCNGEAHEEIRRRYRRGYSAVEIAPIVDLHVDSVLSHLRRLKHQDVDLGTCRCGQPNGHSGGCVANTAFALSRAEVRRVERLAGERVSRNEISRRTGLSPMTVARYVRPIWEALFAQGVTCGCGKRLGHQGLCAETYEAGDRRRGPAPMEAGLYHRVRRMLLAGVNAVYIRSDLGVTQHAVLRVLSDLSPEQKRQRYADLRRHLRPRVDAARGADLLAKVGAAVPRGIDRAVRDEVIGELCLAITQGDLTLAQVKAHASDYIGRAFSQWASAFGPRSLNEAISEDAKVEMVDLLRDESSVRLVEEMEIGQQPP